MTTYYLDIGNSRYKWMADHQLGFVAPLACEYEGGEGVVGALGHFLKDLRSGDSVFISSVKSDGFNLELASAVSDVTGGDVSFATTGARLGLELAYENPARFGVDRFLVLLGAQEMRIPKALVIDAGTAVTFDGLSGSRHLGGCIYPGKTLLEQSLMGGTARIASDTSELPASIFAGSTRSGVRGAVEVGFRAAVRGIAHDMKRQMGNDCVVLVTGGDMELVCSSLGADCRGEPLLIFLGMRRYLRGK